MSPLILPPRYRARQRGFIINPFAYAGGGGDPYFSSVYSLLHLDGTDATATFTDQISGNTWASAGGSTVISTAQQKFGTASLALNGTSQAIKMTASSAYWPFGTGDFTVECWAYITNTTTSSYPTAISRQGATADMAFQLRCDSGTSGSRPPSIVVRSPGGGATGVTHQTSMTINTWQHIAVVRSSGVIAIYLDGVKSSSTLSFSTTLTPSSGATPHIGAVDPEDAAPRVQYWPGYIDEVRVTVGVARYTADFTPPSAAFPNF